MSAPEVISVPVTQDCLRRTGNWQGVRIPNQRNDVASGIDRFHIQEKMGH